MDNIFLPNRYKDQNYLEYINTKNGFITYKLVLANSLPVRVGYSEQVGQNKIAFVDPSGGPLLSVGSVYDLSISSLKLIGIYTRDKDYYLVFDWL